MSLFDTTSTAVSFKGMTAGQSHRLRVEKAPELAQSRDFNTGEPAVYPDGNPKQSVVVGCTDLASGERVSLWCPKPGALLTAVGEAIKAAGADDLAVGGTLIVTTSGLLDIGGGKSQRGYAATYTPPSAFAQAAGTPPAAAPPAFGSNGTTPPPAFAQQPAAQAPVQQQAPAAPEAGAPDAIATVRALDGMNLPDEQVAAAAGITVEALAAIRNLPAA